MTELEIDGFAPSTSAQTALMVAAKAEVPVTFGSLECKQPSHHARHPYGKMPVLGHGDVTLSQILAIASWETRRMPKPSPQPGSV
ncbi:MAG: hypothetical protein WCE62_08570 [Polyangiales bacterium]